MENNPEWYRKLLRKLNKIKSGDLDLDEYIDEVKAKIEAEDQALSMSGVVVSPCDHSDTYPLNQKYSMCRKCGGCVED